jgi:hypothetical protein
MDVVRLADPSEHQPGSAEYVRRRCRLALNFGDGKPGDAGKFADVDLLKTPNLGGIMSHLKLIGGSSEFRQRFCLIFLCCQKKPSEWDAYRVVSSLLR